MAKGKFRYKLVSLNTKVNDNKVRLVYFIDWSFFYFLMMMIIPITNDDQIEWSKLTHIQCWQAQFNNKKKEQASRLDKQKKTQWN